MTDISEWLEAISAEATTFSDSAMVTKCLVALYVHIIGFWTKAYNVYSSSKSRKLLGAFKAIWTDYDAEFKGLQISMDTALQVFLASASAEHHRQVNQLDKKFDGCKSRSFPGDETDLNFISCLRKSSSLDVPL